MSPTECAYRLIAALDAARRSGRVVHEHELTAAAFDEAIVAEREACAKIADDQAESAEGFPQQMVTAKNIAAAIRARGNKETP